MNFKRFIYSASLCAVGIMLAACSNIAEDERFETMEPVIPDSIPDDSTVVVKRVLIEDFTGQRCVNCPDGAAAIEQIQKSYGEDRIVAVGLYSGPLGKYPNGNPLPLYTDDANWYYEQRGVTGQPTAQIDRGSLNNDPSTWATDVYKRIQMQPEVDVMASCDYDNVSRNVKIDVTADGITKVSGKLQVWLIEDNIVSMQLMLGNILNNDYVHNHVFRATVNDRAGEDISVNEGEKVTRTFNYTLESDWVPENMSVVTFIFNDSGVLQAAKAPLIPKAEDAEGEGSTEEAGGEPEAGQ